MSFRKFGEAEKVVTDQDDEQGIDKTASARWTQEDQRELNEEQKDAK